MYGLKITSIALALGLAAFSAQAATVTPISYEMPQGTANSKRTYYDDSYTGANVGGHLSGGVGDLTDGVIATQNMSTNNYEQVGLYVSWNTNSLKELGLKNPTITWNFDRAYEFTSMTFWFSRTDVGSTWFGLQPPSRIQVEGKEKVDWVWTEAWGDVIPMTIALGELGHVNSITTEIIRAGSWIALSEVTFEVSSVPLPASGLLLVAGIGALGMARRRRKAVSL